MSNSLLKIYTESGSIYTIDDVEKTWSREKGENAAKIRTDSGAFNRRSEIEEGGYLTLFCPPINPPYTRMIQSTRITKIEVIE